MGIHTRYTCNWCGGEMGENEHKVSKLVFDVETRKATWWGKRFLKTGEYTHSTCKTCKNTLDLVFGRLARVMKDSLRGKAVPNADNDC